MDIFFIDLFSRFVKIKTLLTKEGSLKVQQLPLLQEKLRIDVQQSDEIKDQFTFREIVKFMFLGQFKTQTSLVIFFYILESFSRNFMSISLSNLLSTLLSKNDDAVYYAILVVVLSFTANISRHQAITKSMEFSAKCRFTLLSLLYKKLLHSKSQKIDTGKLIGLASSDISMLEYFLMLIFQIFIVPISFIFGSLILCHRFQSIIGLIPIILISLMYPFQAVIQKKQINFTKQYKKFQDQRLKLQSEFVENIKIIKIYNITNKLKSQIIQVRKQEERYLFKAQMVQLLDRTFNFFAQIWASLIFFIILYIFDYELSVPAMIATIQQLQYLKVNCVQQVSYGIQSYLNIKMTIKRYCESFNSIKQFESLIISQPQKEIMNLNNVSLKWENSESFINDLSLKIQEKDFLLITGKLGSGKSSLLLSLLNAGPIINQGKISQRESLTRAFVEQEPMLFEDTIQNNITFGKVYLEELYQKVIEVVCLKEEIEKMQLKHQTMINDRQTTLSGGQKTRIALARALYSLADLIILDDPFSSLDKEVQQNIFYNMQEFLQNYHLTQTNKSPAILLTTNSNVIINKFQQFYSLENGKLNLVQNEQFSPKQQVHQKFNDSQEEKQNDRKQAIIENSKVYILKQQSNYLYYFGNWSKQKFISYIYVLVVIGLNLNSEVLYNLYYNGISSMQQDNKLYTLQFLSLLCFFALLNNYLKYNLNSFGCFSSNSYIHNKMIDSISNAKLSYYDKNPGSAILSKFSSDLTIADNMISTTLYDFWELSSYFIVSLLSLVILYQKFFIVMIITVIMNLYIFLNYKTLILKSQELDQQTKAPLIDFFKKTVSGLRTIQIFEQQKTFENNFNKAINNVILSNTTYYYSQRLFGLSIDLVGLIVQQFGIFLIYQNRENETSAQALLLLMIFNENQQWFLRQTLSFMTQMNCIKRMQELLQVEQEQSQQATSNQKVFLKGNINFKRVSLKFGQDYALKDLDFVVEEGQKIGIIGRTGAGKSSIISIIFKLYDVDSAEVLQVDSQDLRNMSAHSVRENICIIPQNPLIFNDSIRNNIDLHQNHSDAEIIKVLQEVGLYEYLQNISLDDQFGELSSGQKQLVSLSRVLLEDKNIIIMDEATSNIDKETDRFIQSMLLEKLKGKTVITIAHKTETIINYDKVYLIDNGSVVKVGTSLEVIKFM